MGALPTPSHPVSASDLARFKDSHHDKLRRLRTHLDAKLVELAAIEDNELRVIKQDNLVASIQDDVHALSEEMRKRNWPKIILACVGGVIGGALATAGTLATGGEALAVGLAVGGGVFSLGNSVYQATEMFKNTRFDPRSPYAYAVMARNYDALAIRRI
jgi:hypothetical protein